MNLADRIEKRRFIGREFLLWLWFEAEVFEATLSAHPHGSFGMWFEGQLVLSQDRESTRIKGGYPTAAREAKEALLVGKLPELGGIHLSWRGQEFQFVLRGERIGISGLKLPAVLGDEDEPPALESPRRGRQRKGREEPADQGHEVFYERMSLARDVEGLLETLYAEFLALRLGAAWDDVAWPLLRRWADGDADIDFAAYRDLRKSIPSKARSAKRVATR